MVYSGKFIYKWMIWGTPFQETSMSKPTNLIYIIHQHPSKTNHFPIFAASKTLKNSRIPPPASPQGLHGFRLHFLHRRRLRFLRLCQGRRQEDRGDGGGAFLLQRLARKLGKSDGIDPSWGEHRGIYIYIYMYM